MRRSERGNTMKTWTVGRRRPSHARMAIAREALTSTSPAEDPGAAIPPRERGGTSCPEETP